ncbi:hypothetical protein C8R42DRAFT_716269 [Lentinula raphanica]|nr:hypothetical protein C8R42DRAFT_716269 [Lentinula raphanica]
MPSDYNWPSMPIPPFQRPAHWPSHIDHQNIYLTGELERSAILQTIDPDERVRSDVLDHYVDSCIAERNEYRRRMAEIRPSIERKVRNDILEHIERASRSNGWPITDATLYRIRCVAHERAEYIIHLTLREEDAKLRELRDVDAGRRRLWVETD